METIKEKATGTTDIKMKLSDILLDVTWSKISRRYFGKSASWIYNKMNGSDGNGGPGDFTYEERIQLRNGLYDFAERIRKIADSLV
jgi:hypothetical protein